MQLLTTDQNKSPTKWHPTQMLLSLELFYEAAPNGVMAEIRRLSSTYPEGERNTAIDESVAKSQLLEVLIAQTWERRPQ